ncbi:hypothetical protein L484_011011 [Morus notabilis]|uniref:Uncharacterized protein n=1 Tax=Morus notabilis TaxID=981085 RepID=W9REV5_9ROSA|nr:hypothetical protein L484_011011 [Morus notabilis]
MPHKLSAKQKKKSLCEKSMLLVANIIKLSSLSFVTVSFNKKTSVRSTPKAVEKKRASSSTAKVAETMDSLVPECSRSQRSKEPESGSKPRSCLMELPKKVSPLYVTREKEQDIDDRAADFIRRTHEKIKKSDLNSATKRFSYKFPISAPNIVREVKLSKF